MTVKAKLLGKEQVGSGLFENKKNQFHADGGLTKREYYARLAMQGLLAKHGLALESVSNDVIQSSVKYADALLEELAKD
jgi:hypothetical protein